MLTAKEEELVLKKKTKMRRHKHVHITKKKKSSKTQHYNTEPFHSSLYFELWIKY